MSLPPEATSYFARFPPQQYLPEQSSHSHTPSRSGAAGGLPPSMMMGHGGGGRGGSHPLPVASATTPMPISPTRMQPPPQSHWSRQELNPFVPKFSDIELERESSGDSVLEAGSILGESGRTYHSYKSDTSAYLLPNDPAEQDRLDLQHAMLSYLWDGELVLAPLPRAPKMVLDVATGTGIWALEFARANPSSFVVGTDLSKIQPEPDVRNCLFEKVDCEDDWMWSYKYDYIHIRMIVSAIRNPQRLIKQAYEHLNPGGWLEMVDVDWDLLSEDGPDRDVRVATCHLKRWADLCAVGAAANGVDVHKAPRYKRWLLEAGFSEVREEQFKLPCTPWPTDPKARRVGLWMQANYLGGLRGVAFKMLRSAGMSQLEIEEFIAATREEVKHGNIRGYTPLYVVYGKKPYDF
ncbi:S-adenosyl-L-methionine-dependent methyltransferase [Xylariales sp. PMI_506]|nr:S-adenosyl-L-methionine-dependent methyltransferase [Xylariales sp. PMI_506]